jgi:hypothetical protein
MIERVIREEIHLKYSLDSINYCSFNVDKSTPVVEFASTCWNDGIVFAAYFLQSSCFSRCFFEGDNHYLPYRLKPQRQDLDRLF